jgi:hypothetical protein
MLHPPCCRSAMPRCAPLSPCAASHLPPLGSAMPRPPHRGWRARRRARGERPWHRVPRRGHRRGGARGGRGCAHRVPRRLVGGCGCVMEYVVGRSRRHTTFSDSMLWWPQDVVHWISRCMGPVSVEQEWLGLCPPTFMVAYLQGHRMCRC